MKNFFKIFSFVLIAGFLFNSCRNPAYNIDVLMDANIMNYKATLIVTDVTGATPAGLTATVSGQDADKVYDFSGKKALFAPGGVTTVGIPYTFTPTANAPLKFNVLFRAPGYLDKLIPVEIQLNQYKQTIEVTMAKPANTESTAVATVTANLAANGATTAPVSIATPVSTIAQSISVTVPTGTQFKNAAGTTLTGQLTAQIVNFDVSDNASLELFPGGDLSAPVVTFANNTSGSAFILPAGFSDIQMKVGGSDVKTFTQPINISLQLDPAFIVPSTNAPVKVGDVLDYFSYDNSGVLKVEGSAPVTSVGGKLVLAFTTNHLSVHGAGIIFNTTACADIKVTASAPWLTEGSSRPVTVEIYNAAGTELWVSKPVTIEDGLVSVIGKLPSVAVSYKVIDITGEQLATGTIADPCAGAPVNITVNKPSGTLENIRLVLNVTCPSKGRIIVPNFDLFFKAPGAPDSDYKLLGTVEKGVLTTNVLKINSTYQFKATWGNDVKVLSPRTITSADMSTVVGEGYYGDKAPEYNRALLIEACNNF